MSLFYNFNKAGKGVAKSDKKKGRVHQFFSIYFINFWKIIELSLLYLLACIPIVTFGPATAGLTTILRKYSTGKHPFIWSDFWESFKKNFKQSFVVGLLDLLIVASIITGVYIYPQLAKSSSNVFFVPMLISFSIGIIAIIMNFYLFIMIVSVDLKLKDVIKNSFILSCVAIKQNIITLLINALIVGAIIGLMCIDISFVMIFPLFGSSLIAFVSIYNSYPIVKKYIIDPYYQKNNIPNPEDEIIDDDDDTIFSDDPILNSKQK